MLKKIIYLTSMLYLSVVIWHEMYLAQFDDYDDNWGRLIVVFLVSLFTSLTLIILAIKQKNWIKNEILGLTIFFLLANSPITIFIVVMNYALIFNAHLKN